MRSLDAFWSKVNIAGPDECWTWKAGLYHDGYGQLGYRDASGRQHTIRAHAFALILATGQDQGGRFALHRCDNPPCCNPDHLYWGDQKRNIADMDRRGRRVSPEMVGELNPNHRLSRVDVLTIRALYAAGRHTQAALAEQFEVRQAHISRVVRGVDWARSGGDLVSARRRLTEDEVRELRRLYATGDVTQRELADYYGVSQQVISYAVRRHTWSHIE